MAETKYTIGKPAPNDITESTVRFPMSPSSHSSTEFLNEVVTLEGAKLVWDSGTDYLVMQTHPSESLQDVADREHPLRLLAVRVQGGERHPGRVTRPQHFQHGRPRRPDWATGSPTLRAEPPTGQGSRFW